jgi:hypothetical protein
MAKKDYDSELLGFVEELATIAEQISYKLHNKLKNKLKEKTKITDRTKITDNALFVCMFLSRTAEYGKNIGYLTRQRSYHEATIIARVILEGYFYFQRYVHDRGFAKQWRLYSVYEDILITVNNTKNERLEKWRKNIPSAYGSVADDAIEQWQLDNTLGGGKKWYGSDIPHVINAITDRDAKKEAQKLYISLYSQLSRTVHWSILGVGATFIDINAALAVTFRSLFIMCSHANEIHKLGFNDDLTDLCDRYLADGGVQRSVDDALNL